MAATAIPRRKALAVVAGAVLAPAFAGAPAEAASFHPRIEARDSGNKVRVRVWVSASLGPIQLNNHFLGTFYVPKGSSLSRTVNVGLAQIGLVMKAKNQVVEATIKMLAAGFATQKKVLRAGF